MAPFTLSQSPKGGRWHEPVGGAVYRNRQRAPPELAQGFGNGSHASFRNGVPFLFILGVIVIATCLMLFTALRHPDLLSLLGSHLKYAISTADEAELDVLDARFAAILDEKQPYLDSDFSLAELSALLNAPVRHISQLINARHGMSFSACMNFRRAGLPAHLLATTAKPAKTIMFEARFSSKSILNREFKRHFGLSPSDYRRKSDGESHRRNEIISS